MPKKKKKIKCNHIIAFHIGHSEISEKEANRDKEVLKDDCCGGVMLLNYCPICGAGIRKIINKLSK